MRAERGFTYLGLLIAIALVALWLSTASEMWVSVDRRQRLEQLDFVGRQFVAAIGSYYESTPGSVKRHPPSLAALLLDERRGFTQRHLRRIYLNPFTGTVEWEIIDAPSGGIQGVVVRTSVNNNPLLREYRYVPMSR